MNPHTLDASVHSFENDFAYYQHLRSMLRTILRNQALTQELLRCVWKRDGAMFRIQSDIDSSNASHHGLADWMTS